ncbi:MAG: histidine phosphatase family protein [Deltaproteobacteria bacterium]|nr:histidine phosphatase family protein [Deltaproteobacteria bacterium]
MDPTRLYLIRHGQVVGHHEQRYNGHSDVDITETGRGQMSLLADFLSRDGIEAVYSSDLKRAYKGADIIAAKLGLTTKRVHALRELNFGRWEGLTRDEAVERFPDDHGFSFRNLAEDDGLGGENLILLQARVMPAIEEIIERHRNKKACLVLHGGVNRVILCSAMGLPLKNFFRMEQDYGCLNIIDCFDDGIRVVKLLNRSSEQSALTTFY